MNFIIDGIEHKAYIYDTKGFDKNPGVQSIAQFKTYTSFIILYDITDRKSYENVKLCI
jgi:hypothetical protein